ncbi:MAG: AbrB/MazE/SpoVT family DNA-binding domain-containing protein [Deltaproteobacteria bacterium]|nr:AbrB/MazE/SpoVT family DNA-binding domain-containing protein [Deltaproteobacteria bacterium]
MRTVIKKNGAVAIPAEYRKILGLKAGDEVTLLIQEGEIRIIPQLQALQHARALVRRFIPEGRNLSDELIQDRRAEKPIIYHP